MTVQEEINLIAERIIQLYRPDKIILFGSWARDDADKQSDIDLLVISDREKHLPRYQRGLDVRLQLSAFKTPKDILFYTHDDVNRWRGVPQAFINTVLSEGKILYERAN
ncbi:MAG: nucleotidyltransferase domain-containing protein [Chloroflexi bacterium]|nr:nucleotidyltransferase domain-containing protein [Chloroflexota bacterium]